MAQALAEKLEHTGSDESEKRGLSATKRAVGKYARAAVAKRKRNRAVSPEDLIVRSESRTLAREREIRARARRGKSGLHGEGRQVPRSCERESKKSFSRRSRRKHERVRGRKSRTGET